MHRVAKNLVKKVSITEREVSHTTFLPRFRATLHVGNKQDGCFIPVCAPAFNWTADLGKSGREILSTAWRGNFNICIPCKEQKLQKIIPLPSLCIFSAMLQICSAWRSPLRLGRPAWQYKQLTWRIFWVWCCKRKYSPEAISQVLLTVSTLYTSNLSMILSSSEWRRSRNSIVLKQKHIRGWKAGPP